MKKSFSRISFFVLTALLLGGFPNYMMQEAHAAVDTWTAPTTTNVGITNMYGVSMSSSTNGVAVGNSGTIVYTSDGGDTWTAATTTNVGTTYVFGVSMSSSTNGVAVGLSGVIVYTGADSGGTGVAPVTDNGGGSRCHDCEAPTLGIDKSGKRLVTNGFTYNGNSVDVERFFTPYPLITANVGQTNKADFKIYENEGPDNIKHFSFAFGLGKDQIISESKAMIELDIDWDGAETVTITDPQNALDDVKVETSAVSCDGDVRVNCLGVTVYHTFRAPLDFNIVATDVWDNGRNSWQNYYNHGIEVVGESLNPAKEHDGINRGHIYHLTETSKTTAVDEFGDSWSLQYDTWGKDYVSPSPKLTSLTNYEKLYALEKLGVINGEQSFGYERYDVEFATYKKEQELYANQILTEICQSCSDEAYDKINDIILNNNNYSPTSRADDVILQAMMVQEESRAQKYLDELFEYYYGNTHGMQ
ncbi:MAG: WD40/YVTN/BNR-like repeat-containing protein [Candidatus Nitrosopumilus sp. bin_6a]